MIGLIMIFGLLYMLVGMFFGIATEDTKYECWWLIWPLWFVLILPIKSLQLLIWIKNEVIKEWKSINYH